MTKNLFDTITFEGKFASWDNPLCITWRHIWIVLRISFFWALLMRIWCKQLCLIIKIGPHLSSTIIVNIIFLLIIHQLSLTSFIYISVYLLLSLINKLNLIIHIHLINILIWLLFVLMIQLLLWMFLMWNSLDLNVVVEVNWTSDFVLPALVVFLLLVVIFFF